MSATVRPRSSWGARPAQGAVHRIDERAERRAFVVHWLGPAPGVDDPARRLRQAQAYHLDHHGWADIGYNLAVGLDGSAWEARGWDAVGAHAPSYNRSAYGVVVLMGAGELVTPAAVDTLRELYAEATRRADHVLTPLDHRATGRDTECAGTALRQLTGAWRASGVPAPAAAVASSPRTPGPPYPGAPLRVGTRGAPVVAWQRRMTVRGWSLLVDGLYGPVSADVCRTFQREKGLAVDGVVGPRTWAATWAAPVT